MWLLNTVRAELEFFPTPESVPGGYAILSHVWGEDEQTFQDLQAIRARCAKKRIILQVIGARFAGKRTNPRDHVCDKIREFCIVAEKGGHKWGWADMCCIDKTSSTELSEAIASMYRYYSLADVCYVYMRDVSTAKEDALRAQWSTFRRSQWHRRGWTLQELIAPPLVVFFSETWEPLGAKADLADLLQEITRVPVAVLKLEAHPSSYCVAARMSWAAGRETTRPEDEAYCLMGIFGIFMPPLYGEGRHAFFRLQEEIMRRVDDPSLFAWGRALTPTPSVGDMRQLGSGRIKAFNKKFEATALFARSPSDFEKGYCITPRSGRLRSQTSLLGISEIGKPAELSKLPTFTVTPYGVKAYLPVFTVAGVDILIALLWGIEMKGSKDTTLDLALPLRRMESPDDTRPLYVPCVFCSFRILTSLEALKDPRPQQIAVETEITPLEWREIYIVRGDPPAIDPASGLQMVSASLRAPFYFPQSNITEFLGKSWIQSYSLHPSDPTNISWQQHMALEIQVNLSRTSEKNIVTVVVCLGLCAKASLDHPRHWAKIVEYRDTETDKLDEEIHKIEHACAENHVDKCPMQAHPLRWQSNSQWRWGLNTLEFPTDIFPLVYTREMSLQLSFEPYFLSPMLCRKVSMKWVVRH